MAQIKFQKHQDIQFGSKKPQILVWQVLAQGVLTKLTKLTKLPNCQTHDSQGFDGIRVKIQFGSLAEIPPA